MRLAVTCLLASVMTGCTFNYDWINTTKTDAEQTQDKSECLNLASIVMGSNQELLDLARSPPAQPNQDLYFDCLLQKGYIKKHKA